MHTGLRLSDQTAPATPLPVATAHSQPAQWRVVAIVAAVIVALFVLVALFNALFHREPPPAPPLPPGAFRATPEQMALLKIVPVTVGANAEVVRASGSIAADGDHSTPVLLPFSGQVIAVLVEAGQRVAPGQPLLRIASPEMVDARNALTGASAQEMSAAAALRVAQANAARQKAIYETAGGALKDYSQAQADLAAAQSALRTAQSAARAARERLAIFGRRGGDDARSGGQPVTVYRAPVAGLVADRNVAPGQFIAPGGGTPLMTITDPSRVWLVAQLPESEAAAVRVGDRVTVTTPALPGRSFAATIDNVGAALDPNTHRLPVRATVSNPDGALKPQMFASFSIARRIGSGDGILVPSAAVIHEGDDARVWVQARDGLFYGRPVRVGDSAGGMTRITQGLRPGDRVVASGALFVNEAGIDQ